MLVAGSIVGIVLMFLGLYNNKRVYDDCEISLFLYIGGGIFVLLLLIILAGASHIAEEKTINGQIELYERENAQIEVEINDAIDEYVQLKCGGVKRTNSTKLTTLVSIYREVCSSDIIQEKLTIYMGNEGKITELKEKVLEIYGWKWWIYFG
jgi:hypothetical protein